MNTVKITDYPEIKELFSVLEENGLHKERNDVSYLVGYIEGMESRLSDMMSELEKMHKEVSQIHDKTIRAKCAQLTAIAEEKLHQTGAAISTVKTNLVRSAENAVKAFREKGRTALLKALEAMKLPDVLVYLKTGLHRSAESMQESAARMDVIRMELHEVGQHMKNTGRVLHGKPAVEAGELQADKGVLAKLRSFAERMSKGFSDMEKGADRLLGKMCEETELPDKRNSVKTELRGIQNERAHKSKTPVLTEQAR